MRKFSSPAALVALLGLATAGCGQIDGLKAKMAFKDANTAYQTQDYKTAAEKYEEVIALAGDNPNLAPAFFFLGNSYDQMYRPTRAGDPVNDAYLTKAIDNYKKGAERSQDKLWKQRSLQYLVAAYTDKLQDPSQAEPVLQSMIELDPKEPGNYNVLSKIYEDGGDYEQAEQTLLKAREMKPEDETVYTQLAGFYQRQGDYEKQLEALTKRAEVKPNDPVPYYNIAVAYWETASRNFSLTDDQKLEMTTKGLEAADKALAMNPDYADAVTYKGLLLRTQALVEKNPSKQQALVREADQLAKSAEEIRNRQKAGATE